MSIRYSQDFGCKLVPETTFKRGYNKSIVS
ncbi:hypothetical protein LAP8965_03123 [Lactiplantibacillus plantarum]|nr:hypothetical protein LAP8963_03045 [Lactiplantibacillus plantarum]SPE13726.1 hypothetical protein LAP8964_03124 [Lactiplantibacillus plantarum]SPH08339.1 hypothetical protein LAP8965_03123 [Lactiplantibacillus plantarum]SPH10979.1 hypothetical protein LAP8966_03196 [Lactiplantibacillus plantarum]